MLQITDNYHHDHQLFVDLKNVTDIETRTEIFHTWMKTTSDDNKMRYALNWRKAHSLLNVSVNILGRTEKLQNIDFYKIYKSRDLGEWSNGNKVIA